MRKIYEYNGYHFQYEEGTQPEGAVEVRPEKKPDAKQVRPANKARRTRTKKVE